jgi:hypothetical protein
LCSDGEINRVGVRAGRRCFGGGLQHTEKIGRLAGAREIGEPADHPCGAEEALQVIAVWALAGIGESAWRMDVHILSLFLIQRIPQLLVRDHVHG